MSNAPAISRRTISEACSTSDSGRLEEQLVVDLEDEPGLQAGVAQRARRQRTIATLMMSAAVPWMTMLTASRSPSIRVWRWRARSSGSAGMRPNSVATKPSSCARRSSPR